MKTGETKILFITKDNYEEIIAWEREYYMNYDYDTLYEGYSL